MANTSRKLVIIFTVILILLLGIGASIFIAKYITGKKQDSIRKNDTANSNTITDNSFDQVNTEIVITASEEEHEPRSYMPILPSSQGLQEKQSLTTEDPGNYYKDKFTNEIASSDKTENANAVVTVGPQREKIFPRPRQNVVSKDKGRKSSCQINHRKNSDDSLLLKSDKSSEKQHNNTRYSTPVNEEIGQQVNLKLSNIVQANIKASLTDSVNEVGKENTGELIVGLLKHMLQIDTNQKVHATGNHPVDVQFGKCKERNKIHATKENHNDKDEPVLTRGKLEPNLGQIDQAYAQRATIQTVEKSTSKSSTMSHLRTMTNSNTESASQGTPKRFNPVKSIKSSNTIASGMMNALQTEKNPSTPKTRSLVTLDENKDNSIPETEGTVNQDDLPENTSCWSHDQCAKGRLCYDGWCVERADANQGPHHAGAVRSAATHDTGVRHLDHNDVMHLNPLIIRAQSINNSPSESIITATQPIIPDGNIQNQENSSDLSINVVDTSTKKASEFELHKLNSPSQKNEERPSDSSLNGDEISAENHERLTIPEVLQKHRSPSDEKTANDLNNPVIKRDTDDIEYQLTSQMINPAEDSKHEEIQRHKRQENSRHKLSSESVLVGVVVSAIVVLLFVAVAVCCLCYCLYKQRRSGEEEGLITRTLTKNNKQQMSRSDMETGFARSRPPSYRTLAPPDYTETKCTQHGCPDGTLGAVSTAASSAPVTSQQLLQALNHFSLEKRKDTNQDQEASSFHETQAEIASTSTKPKMSKNFQGMGKQYHPEDSNVMVEAYANNVLKESNIPAQAAVKEIDDLRNGSGIHDSTVNLDNVTSASKGLSDDDPFQKLARIIGDRRGSHRKSEGINGLENIAEQRDSEEKELQAAVGNTTFQSSNSQHQTGSTLPLTHEADFSSYDSFSSDGQEAVSGAGDTEIRADNSTVEPLIENVYEEVYENANLTAGKNEIEDPLYENIPRPES